MRWDRLFAELEAQALDEAVAERDALADELTAGEWAGTGWRQMVGGDAVVEVAGLGRVEGRLLLVNEQIVHLGGVAGDVLVAASAVTGVMGTDRGQPEPGTVESRLGWGHAFRALTGEEVRLHRTDGSSVDGTVDVVGRDFVRVRSVAERTVVVPFAALVAARPTL